MEGNEKGVKERWRGRWRDGGSCGGGGGRLGRGGIKSEGIDRWQCYGRRVFFDKQTKTTWERAVEHEGLTARLTRKKRNRGRQIDWWREEACTWRRWKDEWEKQRRCIEDEGWGGGETGERWRRGWMGPRGEISCSSTLGPSDRRLWGSNCLSYVHVNYREREREGDTQRENKENGTKEAQVFPLSKQVNGLTLHRPLITASVSNPLYNTDSLHAFIITHKHSVYATIF